MDLLGRLIIDSWSLLERLDSSDFFCFTYLYSDIQLIFNMFQFKFVNGILGSAEHKFIIDIQLLFVYISFRLHIKKETKRYRAPRVRDDIVIFMAADGDKTAYSFIDQHHGFFTYYILKELKYTRGEITFQDLFNNVTKNQAYESSLQGKLQEPSMIIGGKLSDDWGSRTFINN